MIRLALAFSDFPRPEAAGSAPALPALGKLLSRGHVACAGVASWRHWVLDGVGLAAPSALPAAAIVAGRAGDFALATPLNLVAGLEQVYLDPRGAPELQAGEWQELCASFDREFGSDGFALAPCGRLGLMSMPREVDAATHDPEPLAGCEAGAWLPSGPDGGWLRRVMTEVQMWLHRHPLNSTREARAEAPVNALWLWGLGAESLPLTAGTLPALASDDPVLGSLWRRAGSPLRPSPSSLEAWLDAGAPAGVVTLALASSRCEAAAALELAERSWFEPLAAALAAGRVGRAEMYLGGRVASLGRTHWLRAWRPRRAWREALR